MNGELALFHGWETLLGHFRLNREDMNTRSPRDTSYARDEQDEKEYAEQMEEMHQRRAAGEIVSVVMNNDNIEVLYADGQVQRAHARTYRPHYVRNARCVCCVCACCFFV